jgi:NAD(P)-dependent dehydrogenase (short-subunit alcohol dehydrogenase family)
VSKPSKTALIVGASRGLGLGLVEAYLHRGWHVVATRRGPAPALEALGRESDGRLRIETLDVTYPDAIAALRQRLSAETLDLLLVVAGVSHSKGKAAAEVSTELFVADIVTNALAPMRIIEAFADRVAGGGVIAALSSILGSVASNTGGGYEVYRASKAALNTLLRSYAARARGRAIVALHPGWVRTDMGGSGADIDVAESVAGMVAVLDGRVDKPGCVYLDYRGRTIPW